MNVGGGQDTSPLLCPPLPGALDIDLRTNLSLMSGSDRPAEPAGGAGREGSTRKPARVRKGGGLPGAVNEESEDFLVSASATENTSREKKRCSCSIK